MSASAVVNSELLPQKFAIKLSKKTHIEKRPMSDCPKIQHPITDEVLSVSISMDSNPSLKGFESFDAPNIFFNQLFNHFH